MTIKRIWFADEKIFILTDDGKELWQSLLWYPRLQNATNSQRMDYEIDSEGIRWDELDEDVSLESFTYDNPMPEGISYIFKKYPELNAAAIARRMNMKQSLLAAYINGTKKPSSGREKQIIDTIKTIGVELSCLHIA